MVMDALGIASLSSEHNPFSNDSLYGLTSCKFISPPEEILSPSLNASLAIDVLPRLPSG